MDHERFNSDGAWGKMVFNLMGQQESALTLFLNSLLF